MSGVTIDSPCVPMGSKRRANKSCVGTWGPACKTAPYKNYGFWKGKTRGKVERAAEDRSGWKSMIVNLLERRQYLMMILLYLHQDRGFLGWMAWLVGQAWRHVGRWKLERAAEERNRWKSTVVNLLKRRRHLMMKIAKHIYRKHFYAELWTKVTINIHKMITIGHHIICTNTLHNKWNVTAIQCRL